MKKLCLLISLLSTCLFNISIAHASIHFDGLSQAINSTNFSTLNGSKTASWGAWFNYAGSLPSGYKYAKFYSKLYAKDNTSGNQDWNLDIEDCSFQYGGPSGFICASIGLDNVSQSSFLNIVLDSSTVPLTAGRHFIMVTWNNATGNAASDFTFYIDNVAQSSSNVMATHSGNAYSSSTSIEDHGQFFYLGGACGAASIGNTCPTEFFAGTENEPQVYGTKLSSSQVNTLWHGGVAAPALRIPLSIGATPLIYLPLDDQSSGNVTSSPLSLGSLSVNLNTIQGTTPPVWSSDMEGGSCSPNCSGAVCGAADGCGGQCSAGSCTAPQTCGGGGTANVCGGGGTGKSWYVRDGGGNASQCDGSVNVTLAASSGGHCAYNHPRYVMGWGCTSSGTACAGGSNRMGAGDTLFIDGDSDINAGQQAQYEIGYDDTNSGLTPGCSSSFPYDCTLGNLPAGTSTSNRTSVVGTGTHKPQLWGTQRVWSVLYGNNNFTSFRNLEITSHSGCGLNFPANGCNYGGPYPYGQWAEDGLTVTGSGNLYQDVYVHGIKRYGMTSFALGDNIFTRVWLIGNGLGGFSSDPNSAFSGTLTWNQPIVEWNGCEEGYPLPLSGIDNPGNYTNCSGQGSNIIADGIAFGNDGNGNAGSWNIFGPGSISFNTQDGLDTLHGNGNGTIQIDKMRFEGNAGDQIKLNAVTETVTNSLVIGDCGWWYQSPQSGTEFSSNPLNSNICRANGDVIVFITKNGGTTGNFFNNTIVSNGNVSFLQSGACTNTDVMNIKNNILLGGYVWIEDTSWNGSGQNSQTTYQYVAGTDGNGTGCTNLVVNEDYNLITGTKNNNQGCNGIHDQCGANPGFTGTIPMGTSGGGRNTYYTGNSAISLVPLSSSSVALHTGVGALMYWNNSNDYYNVVRPNPPSKGGLELASCGVGSWGCFLNSDCCTGVCSGNICTGGVTCSADLSTCSVGSQCCNANCCVGVCGSTSCQTNPTGGLNDFTLSGAYGS